MVRTAPAVILEPVFKHLYQYLTGGVRITSGPTGNKWVVSDHGDLMPDIPVELTLRAYGVAQDVFQWIRRRSNIYVSADKSGPIMVVILDGMPGDVTTPG